MVKCSIVVPLLSIMMICMPGRFHRSYIKIEYTGETDKLFPTLVLYTKNSIDTSNESYIEQVQISKTEFQNIKTAIDSVNNDSTNGTIQFPIVITVFRDDLIDSLSLTETSSIRKLFREIEARVVDSQKRQKVTEVLQELARRLGIENVGPLRIKKRIGTRTYED